MKKKKSEVRGQKSGAHIGESIRFLRLCAGQSLRELERECEVKAATIWRTERGLTDPTLSTLEAIAHGLGMSFFELVEFHEVAG